MEELMDVQRRCTMILTSFPIFAALTGMLIGSHPFLGNEKTGLLNLRLLPEPPSQEKVPLSDALQHLGGSVSGGYVLFGSEIILKDGKEPTVTLEIKPGTDLDSALRGILDQVDGYGMEVVSDHLVDIYPRRFRNDPADALNLRVPSFSVVNTRAGAILASPERFIPELKDRLTPPLEPGMHRLELYVLALNQMGPLVTLQVRDATVRQILNAVSKATEGYGPPDEPQGWAYLFEPDPKSRVPKHSWKPLYSLPRDWRSRGKNTEDVPE
jgi:hypothetical protein